jgi:NADH:ubiquinone oxidoreductase subunit 3 (subunit A)
MMMMMMMMLVVVVVVVVVVVMMMMMMIVGKLKFRKACSYVRQRRSSPADSAPCH